MSSLYEELGVKPDATQAEVKAAWRSHATKHHPDRANGGSAEKMARVNAAYEILSDPDKRKHYDATGSTAEVKSHEQRVREVFMQIVGSVLANEGNIVMNARRVVRSALSEAYTAQSRNRRVAASLTKRMTSVKVKGPENLIVQMVQAKLAEAVRFVAEVDEKIAVLEGVGTMLDTYASSEMDAAEQRFPFGAPTGTFRHA